MRAKVPSPLVIGQNSLIATCAAIVTLACVARFTIGSVWDDAYITVRYADNWLATQRLSWDPGGPPTYGLTGPLYLLVVAPMRMLTGGSPALVACLSSLLCGLAATALMIRLAWSLIPEASRRFSNAALVVLFSFAFSAGSVTTHFLSGMDTMFAVAYLAVYLILLGWRERAAGARADHFTGLWGGLALLARPDLLLFTLTIPAVLVSLAPERAARASAFRVLGATLLVVGASLALTAWYFDSALPLPFHAKGGRLYGDSIFATYAGVAAAQLREFGKSFWFLFLPIGAAVVAPLRWWRNTSALDKGIVTGTVAFLGYHALFVLPIMFYEQRFYYPALPALIYLGVRASVRWVAVPRLPLGPTTPGFGVAFVLSMIGLAGLAQSAIREWRVFASPLSRAVAGDFSLSDHYVAAGLAGVWPGLDGLAALPDDLVIATTEVGLPGVMNPGKKIIDLSGLNNTEIAMGHATAASVLRATLPDVIYLPHPDYKEMIQAIRAEPNLLSQYDLAREAGAPPALGLAILKASPYHDALQEFLGQREKGPVATNRSRRCLAFLEAGFERRSRSPARSNGRRSADTPG